MSEEADKFVPDKDLLAALIQMGINENLAKEALFCTGNKSVDDAINYIVNNKDERNELGRCEDSGKDSSDADWEDQGLANYKMVHVVNCSLKMKTGKIAAQVGHACLGLYRSMFKENQEELNQWEELGEKKVVLKGNDAEHLKQLYHKAISEGLPAYLVRDAGHTQIASGSLTVLSLFGIEEHVENITGKLPLL
ncbi:putative peptidyl-tRNA hydrolase 2 isoform X2 [Rhynchophorus ferrugineus]|uniref:putative peptidyl-tRNA hydrolase 2 isoform X2 n=1 Tax=Rhynchophorus ferrugineus TaxID=354439 RepID=UPI003FCC9233